jgi:hypothetical protein
MDTYILRFNKTFDLIVFSTLIVSASVFISFDNKIVKIDSFQNTYT